MRSISKGKNVVVGIIDRFDLYQKVSHICSKAINLLTFKNYARCDENFNVVDRNHGIHVAGIIVSDTIDSKNSPMTLGVAPEAGFEMFDVSSLETFPVNQPPHLGVDVHHINWTVTAMADSLTELWITGKLDMFNLRMDMIQDRSLVDSPARIINWSESTSSLDVDDRLNPTVFEGLYLLPTLLETIKTRLLVLSAGNDGVFLDSTPQYRLMKSLVHSPITSNHIILVTNLMQDGLSLHSTSNSPGKNTNLQMRTLSALGTNIKSTIMVDIAEAMDMPEDLWYTEMTGTSMAAPHVSGVAAIVLSNYPHLTPQELANCLLQGATPLLLNDENVTMELPYISSGELHQQFNQSNKPLSIDFMGSKIHRHDWERGQELYGQGRVNLKGALTRARARYSKI